MPAPPPAPTVAKPVPPKPEQVSLPPAPELPPQTPQISVPPSTPGKVPPPPRRRATNPRPRPAPEPPAAPEPAPPPAGPVPQLGQILTVEQQQAYNEEIDRNIARAQRALAGLNGRRLTSEQQTYLDRIRAFVQQALEARKSDLFRARNLAERASLLAADLSRSLQ